MHYYQHNIGDYRKDTSHLTLIEHGIYRQLIDSYYLDELPLCADLAKLMRSHSIRSAEEKQSLKNVLDDFFELTDAGYIHKRCDQVIAEYHGKSEKAKASAKARWDKTKDANAMRSHSDGNANHKPITNNHKPITNVNTLSPPIGVSDSVFKDYIQLRNKLKAPVTATAIKGLQKEADKAGISLEQVMTICCQNGWRGFKADWVKQSTQGKSFKQMDSEAASHQLKSMMLGTVLPVDSQNAVFTIKEKDERLLGE